MCRNNIAGNRILSDAETAAETIISHHDFIGKSVTGKIRKSGVCATAQSLSDDNFDNYIDKKCH